jgi:hypothetical protein
MVRIRSSCTPGGARRAVRSPRLLPEVERATPAVIHWLRRKRSHLAIAEMVRAEFVKFDQELPAAPEPE